MRYAVVAGLIAFALLAGAVRPLAWATSQRQQRLTAAPQHLFSYPESVAVDIRGNLYVTNGEPALMNAPGKPGRYADTVAKLSPDGRLLARWGGRGSSRGRFRGPSDVAVDRSGHVYVLDSGNNRIQKLSPEGKVLAVIGRRGRAPGEFNAPISLALDPSGNIYVADGDNDRVQVLSPQGKVLRIWGTSGSKPGQFHEAWGIALGRSGNVYVSDHVNWRVQEFTPTGRFIRKWGSPGPLKNQFIGIAGMAVDSRGYVYVLEEDVQVMQKFTANGKWVAYWFRFQLHHPMHLAIDQHDNLYIANSDNNSILKLSSSGRVLRVFR